MKTQKYAGCVLFMLRRTCKIIPFLSGAFLIFVSLSCGTIPIGRYNPDPALAQGVVEHVSFSSDVTIINDQPATDDHLIRFKEAVVNYNEFTQSLVDALRMELERNGIQVKDSSEKKLYVKVTKVDMQLRQPNFRAYIDAEVKTGEDHIEFFEVTRASYASPFNLDTGATRPLDSAFKDIVREIMENTQIQEYINN